MILDSYRKNLVQKINNRVFYGWVILLVGGAGVFASGAGQSHIFSVFIGPIGRDLSLTHTTIASAYAVATLIAAMGLPLMGRLIDRYGTRATVFFVVLLLGLACFGFAVVINGIWLAIGFAALRFLGQGSMMMNSSNMVSQWFGRRRGFALSLMALGFSLSVALHPPLAQWLIDTVGWRQAWLWIGLSTWLLMLPVILIFAHNTPESVGLRPDGIAAEPTIGDVQEESIRHRADVGLSLHQAIRTPAYWIVAAGLFSISMLATALFFFQVSIFEAQGLSAETTAQVFPVIAIVMVVAMPIYGRMLDRYRTERMFAAALLVTATSLIAATQVQGFASALVYAVIFGVNNAASMTLFAFLWPRYFGRRHLGSIQGTGTTIGVVGASVGPLPLGIAFDLFGSYGETLLILAAIPIVCAVLALFIRAPHLQPVS